MGQATQTYAASLESVREAADRIAPYAHITPVSAVASSSNRMTHTAATHKIIPIHRLVDTPFAAAAGADLLNAGSAGRSAAVLQVRAVPAQVRQCCGIGCL